MSFLKCLPTVAVIKNEYQIIVHTDSNGIIGIRIGDKVFYEENSGVLSSEKNYAKINLPQEILDNSCEYTVFFKKTVDRRAYFSEFEDEKSLSFKFKPLKKTDDINIYHIADVHQNYAQAEKTCTYFGNDLDLFILNGDIGEVEREEDYFNVCEFSGKITKGEIPALFARGNHDARGKLAEKYTDFLPSDGKKTYFEFSVGVVGGIVMDCGEDKADSSNEYGGTNAFEPMRRRETEFLKAVSPKGKYVFAVSHICPLKVVGKDGGQFDIERDVYTEWNRELNRMGIEFMLSGHEHEIQIIKPCAGPQQNNYSVIVGSKTDYKTVEGTALTIKNGRVFVKFTDAEHNIFDETEFDI